MWKMYIGPVLEDAIEMRKRSTKERTRFPSSSTTSHDSNKLRKRWGSRDLMTSPFQSWSAVRVGDTPGGLTGRVAAMEGLRADIFVLGEISER